MEKAQQNIDENDLKGFAIEPKKDCPHYKSEWFTTLKEKFVTLKQDFFQQKCKDCGNVGENWICLQCSEIFCSRYVKEHMVSHNKLSDHPIALSFSDGSFWCYKCDSYIINQDLSQAQKIFSDIKFKDEKELEEMLKNLSIQVGKKKEEDQENNDKESTEAPSQSQEEEEKQEEIFTRDDLVQGVKSGKFKKVAFLTGAGISVAAGIPDFRTPGTGLYSQLEKYKLPFPEAIFTLQFFKKQPEPFYTLAKEFLTSGMSPTIAHNLIAEFAKHKMLKINLSQNIDGLELEAGVPENKLVQAHGHFRTSHCIECKKEFPIEEFQKCVKEDKILNCDECSGLVKPDIVFFGESLPISFFTGIKKLEDCDLVFVMGTSLNVQPFASLVALVSPKVPLVLINRENPGIDRENFLFMDGDLEDNSAQLLKDFGWPVPNIERKDPKVNQEFQEKTGEVLNKDKKE